MDNPHYVTPEEAKKKVCPSSMGGLLMVQNTVMASEHGCLGPDCMAWRWAMNFEKVDTPDGKEWSDLYSATHGYCGMVRS